MLSEAHRRLRSSTAAEHRRLEQRIDIRRRLAEPKARRALVAAFHRLHAEVEAGCAPWLSEHPELAFEARRRAPRLALDLAELGGAAPVSVGQVAPGGVAEALGWMYVLEGSTLGGHVIRRELVADGESLAGLGFLDPYGASVGECWRSFMAVVDAETSSPADLKALEKGAQAAFRHAEARLCEDACA